MMLKVMDFYTKGKLIINHTNNTLVSPIEFYILVNDDGKIRELNVKITKNFKFEISLTSPKYDALKLKEYNLLTDYLKFNRKDLMEKWELDEKKFKELEIGLEIGLIESYSDMNAWDKAMEKVNVLFKRGL